MRYAALVVATLALAGCNAFTGDAQRSVWQANSFTFPATFTAGDVRVITERRSPVTGHEIVCTEPSPDTAKAISTAFSVAGQGGDGSASGGLAASSGSAEAIAALAGRSTALLGLRDGLFQACQAYANGAIGADMYALIVSHYGQLMTTLFLGQDITGIIQPTAIVQSPPITASANLGGQGGTSGSGGSPSASASVPTSTPPASLAGSVSPLSSGSAAALVRMNEDYFNIDYNIVHMLAVTCINQGDPTIRVPAEPNNSNVRQANPWLSDICNSLKPLFTQKGFVGMAGISEGLAKAHVITAPVDPTVTTTVATPSKPAASGTGTAASGAKKTATTNKCVPLTANAKPQVEKALVTLGDLKDEPISPSNNLSDAVAKFEDAQSPKIPAGNCAAGQVGQTTLTALQVVAGLPKK